MELCGGTHVERTTQAPFVGLLWGISILLQLLSEFADAVPMQAGLLV